MAQGFTEEEKKSRLGAAQGKNTPKFLFLSRVGSSPSSALRYF